MAIRRLGSTLRSGCPGCMGSGSHALGCVGDGGPPPSLWDPWEVQARWTALEERLSVAPGVGPTKAPVEISGEEEVVTDET